MCEKTNDAYTKAIKYLKTSPMFNLSLSSKELFHSNFLYWLYIAKDNKEAFCSLLNVIGITTDNWGNDWVVKREYLNFDLCVIGSNDKKEILLAVIENKVKSIPTAEQLAKYNEKIKNKFESDDKIPKILLSLTESDVEVDGWSYVSYKRICEKLLESSFLSAFDDYEKRLITDYAKFVQSLIILTEEWKSDAEDESNIFLLDYKERECKNEEESHDDTIPINKIYSKNPDKYRKAQELRIHDLYGKYRTTILKEKLKGIIDSKRFKTKLDITPQIAYSNSLPILEIMIKGIGENKDEVKKKEAEAFFISIQGNQYRHAINARDEGNSIKEKRVSESVTKCEITTDWHWFMNPNKHPNTNTDCFPERLVNSGQRSKICSFAGRNGVNYIYQYKKISPTATVGEILDIMVADVENIIEKFNK